ncbi:hypothetical protein R69658_03907 [Paraburkholderia aspalathi]|uniref:Uncharacterized protein n=2 Tax=Paraburkholderia aspalathi TaxID=1324617 RepID=A0ABM8RXT8_9BURK|nr:hypothetical protein [Paraburkholderia aspalathi]CAE6777378.1 hypothetical protein R69658_03907 [Paraburkholderia aspalathi]
MQMTNKVRCSARLLGVLAALASPLCWTDVSTAQTVAAPQVGSATATPDNAVLLTVFLRHDQSRPLGELNAQLAKQGFYKAFPPPGVEVVSWTVVMGIGQIVTLRLPASRIREVNRVLEDSAWGVYHTDFYPTYDYKAVGLAEHDKAR